MHDEQRLRLEAWQLHSVLSEPLQAASQVRTDLPEQLRVCDQSVMLAVCGLLLLAGTKLRPSVHLERAMYLESRQLQGVHRRHLLELQAVRWLMYVSRHVARLVVGVPACL